jgi:non-lysosomal glucosylceramidase
VTTYPSDRPRNPFPYYAEAWTGLEYTAAAGMLYEGMESEGRECVERVRGRYDGAQRNPYDEAECGHHYARAMAGWAALLAWTGFGYSAVTGTLTLAPRPGRFLWSSGHGWGEYALVEAGQARELRLDVRGGRIEVSKVTLTGFGREDLPAPRSLGEGESLTMTLHREMAG